VTTDHDGIELSVLECAVMKHKCCIGMCRIDCFISVRFRFIFSKKNSDSARNEFGAVRFKKRGSVRILSLFTTHVIANITATVDDMTLTSLMSLTAMTTSK